MCFKKNKIQITNITNLLKDVLELYDTVDGRLICRGAPINLSSTYVKSISLNNPVFYREAYLAISKYKELLNDVTIRFEIIQEKYKKYFHIDKRIKNINSIYSKLDRYNNEKKEKGEMQINKCLNDLFGFRIILNCLSFNKLKKIVEDSIFPFKNTNRLKFIPSIKDGYRAYHVYIKNGNYLLQWELQFWLKRDSRKNLASHHVHKQSYTVWEQNFKKGDLIEVIRDHE